MRSCSKVRRGSAKQRCGEGGSSRRGVGATVSRLQPQRSRDEALVRCAPRSARRGLDDAADDLPVPSGTPSASLSCVRSERQVTASGRDRRRSRQPAAPARGRRSVARRRRQRPVARCAIRPHSEFAGRRLGESSIALFIARRSNAKTGVPLGLEHDFEDRLTVVHVARSAWARCIACCATASTASSRGRCYAGSTRRPVATRTSPSRSDDWRVSITTSTRRGAPRAAEPGRAPRDPPRAAVTRCARGCPCSGRAPRPERFATRTALGRDLKVAIGELATAKVFELDGNGSASLIHCSRRPRIGRRAPTN